MEPDRPIAVPFFFLNYRLIYTLSKQFRGFGLIISNFFPQLSASLAQSELQINQREYCAMAFAASLVNSFAVVFFVDITAILIKRPEFAFYGLFVAAFFFIASFMTIIEYPKIIAAKRARKIENELIPALRQLLIELKSGVTLFTALSSLTTEYEELSKDFTKIVEKIDSGVQESDAISEATVRSPSMQFKKVFWQISNSLKTGSDISNSLEIMLKELMHEKIEGIKKYSSELSPWMMIYMMFTVIVPSLGITMLIIVSTFMNAAMSPWILWAIVGGLIIFQLFFMNFIQSRRPTV